MADSSGHILIVDDNEMNRQMLSRRLESEGHQFDLAEDGQQALQLVQAFRYDLILLDIMMPKMNGYEVLQRLKADPVTSSIPVIVISAISDLDSVVRCIEAGAEDYLFKPFNPILLQARIRAILHKRHAQLSKTSRVTVNQAVSNYVSAVESGINNYLSMALTSSQMLEEDGPLTTEQRYFLSQIKSYTQQALRFMTLSNTFAFLQSENFTPQQGLVSVASLIKNAVRHYQEKFTAKGISVSVNVPNVDLIIHGDESRLLELLLELLDNTSKFVDQGGHITLSAAPMTSKGQSAVEIILEDDGIGIAPEMMEQIFVPFYPTPSGLGLSIARRIIEAHGGELTIDSSVKKGTTFHIVLPNQI